MKEKNSLKFVNLQLSNIKLNFTSHDYLNFGNNSEVIKSATDYSKKYNLSSCLHISNSIFLPIYLATEEAFVNKLGFESAIIFNNLFQANISCLPILLDKKILGEEPIVFCEKYIDPSMIRGCDLAKVKIMRYQDGNLDDLERLLSASEDKDNPKFILVESISIIDGSKIDAKRIVNLSKKYKAFLYVNDSSSFGLYGEKNHGIFEDYLQYIDFYVLSFNRVLASEGCIILTKELIKQVIINVDMHYDYNLCLSPFAIGAVQKSLELIEDNCKKSSKIAEVSSYAREELRKNNFKLSYSNSHIISIIIGCREKSLNLKKYLAENHILVSAITSPLVPYKTSRLLLCINSSHNQENIDRFINKLKEYNDNNI